MSDTTTTTTATTENATARAALDAAIEATTRAVKRYETEGDAATNETRSAVFGAGYTTETLKDLLTCTTLENTANTEAHTELQQLALTFATAILENAPACWDRTHAVTKVREALMFAESAIGNKGIY